MVDDDEFAFVVLAEGRDGELRAGVFECWCESVCDVEYVVCAEVVVDSECPDASCHEVCADVAVSELSDFGSLVVEAAGDGADSSDAGRVVRVIPDWRGETTFDLFFGRDWWWVGCVGAGVSWEEGSVSFEDFPAEVEAADEFAVFDRDDADFFEAVLSDVCDPESSLGVELHSPGVSDSPCEDFWHCGFAVGC